MIKRINECFPTIQRFMQITHNYREGEEVAGDLFEESEYNDINSELSETNPPKYGISSFAMLMTLLLLVLLPILLWPYLKVNK